MSSDSMSGQSGQSAPHSPGRQLRDLLEELDNAYPLWMDDPESREEIIKDLAQRLRDRHVRGDNAELRLRARQLAERIQSGVEKAKAKAPRNFAHELRDLLEEEPEG